MCLNLLVEHILYYRYIFSMGAKVTTRNRFLHSFHKIKKAGLIALISYSKSAMYIWCKIKLLRFFYPLRYIDRVRLAAKLTKQCKFTQAKWLLETIKQKNFLSNKYDLSEKSRLISALNGCDVNIDVELLNSLNIENAKNENKSKYTYALGLFPFDLIEHQKDFLFVSGTPRSGTTALGRILSLSDNIALQMERFNHNGGYHPALFNVSEVKGLGWEKYRYKEYSYKAFDKLPNALYTGDKRPNFLFSWNITKRNFLPHNIKIIHIIRDIEDIACSYNKRASDPNDKWPISRNYKASVYEANRNNKLALQVLSDPLWKDSIKVITYKNCFINSFSIRNMFEWLNIEVDEKLEEKITHFLQKSAEVLNKDRSLPPAHEAYLRRRFDFKTYQQLEKISL